jgi:hypothetical protein
MSNYVIFISRWCVTHTKIRSKLVDIVMAGSQKITLWGPRRTPLGILRVKRFVWIWEQRAINWLVFITETACVYCAVQTGSLNTRWRSRLTVLPVLTNLAPSDQCATLYSFSLKGFCMSNVMSNTRNFTVFVLKCWLTDMSNIFLDISPIYLRTKFHTTGSNPPFVTPSNQNTVATVLPTITPYLSNKNLHTLYSSIILHHFRILTIARRKCRSLLKSSRDRHVISPDCRKLKSDTLGWPPIEKHSYQDVFKMI